MLEMKDTREDLNGGGRNGRDERRDMRKSMDARDEDVDFEEQQEDLASLYANHPSITYIQ